MSNEIKLTHKQKIALLEAVQSGTIDLSIFENDRPDESMTRREIESEIVRLERLGNPRAMALLTLEWCDGKLTDDEYITKRLEL